MRKEKHETGTTAAAAAEKVLVAQQETNSENEESDTITDHSSSMSESKKDHSGSTTQFSVQRSDTDGLRMKISAIRTTVVNTKASTQKPAAIQSSTSTATKVFSDKVNNNSLDSLKIKLSNSSSSNNQNNSKKPANSNNMSVDAVVSGSGSEKPAPVETSTLPITLPPVGPCLSDETESGCSEATNTTVATTTEKTTKKVKVKRKKAQSKGNESKHKSSKKSHISTNPFSSDSDDEPLQKLKQQQRAPRLLITAINTKNTQLKTLISLTSTVTSMNDNIGLSSSDNELPDLVSAAIKRVESDTEDTGGEFSSRLNTKAKNLPQYQSTLLQDFMEKTQMLGQTTAVTPARVPSPETISKPASVVPSSSSQTNHTDVSVSNSNSLKKRRGRPKKGNVTPADSIDTPATITPTAVTINESADSGVISTTSTAQSTSPSPRLTANSQRKNENSTSPTKNSTDLGASSTTTTNAASSSKPKLDFVNLDKRMYATERVLYPPPRNKRRQSTSAGSSQPKTEPKSATGTTTSTKISKEELLLDPVWRKIDVNKKFRRPSVSGYKSDGGGGNTTICSKILAAKSGYVSDYGSAHPRSHHHNHNSGYKSDASCKSRYSTRSCASRRSRAKSCGYRSDYKDSDKASKSTKFRRKRRSCSLMRQHSKSVGNLNEDQDILQLAGLSLGQSSEESNEYVCKPSLECLPTTSVSKKYGEINRFITTGEYFGRGSSGTAGANNSTRRLFDTTLEDGSQDGFRSFSGKLNLLRKNSLGSELATDVLSHMSRKIKSRRSSAASYCSSYYSGVSKVKRRRRRKSFRFPTSSKSSTIDSKLLTEIEIITNTFATLCRIQNGDKTSALLKEKEKLAEVGKFQLQTTGSGGNKRESRDKRSLKKRKLSENIDFALLSGSVGSLTPSSGSTKRRHKKANSSSPDDHKLPLKKRHYLLTPGEKSTEAAAVAKLFANNAEALAAAAAAAKSSGSAKDAVQQKLSTKSSKPAITPKKRHLLQNSAHSDENSSVKGSNCSPLRINVENTSITGGKLLDISPLSTGSTKQSTDAQVHKKRSRLEGVVSKIANHTDVPVPGITTKDLASTKTGANSPQVDSETSCPPPGVFEPSIELEIQIPPIAKLTEAAGIITKSEVDSPLLMDLNKTFPLPTTKVESTRVVEELLNKTGGNLIMKRKRKKINRTGFPTVRRKKRKINENLLLDVTPDISEQAEKARSTPTAVVKATKAAEKICDRVPQTGEASDTFLERANRTPRLSVVSLERLQGTTNPEATAEKDAPETNKRRQKKPRLEKEKQEEAPKTARQTKLNKSASEVEKVVVSRERPNARGRKPKVVEDEEVSTTKRMKKPLDAQLEVGKTIKSLSKETSTNGINDIDMKRLLPAGIDPNINFSCKIRLKRRNSLHSIAVAASAAAKESEESPSTVVNITKDPHGDQLEHDVLPLHDATGADSEAASDTSDEKSSSASITGGRKNARWKKTYLTAGLFSDYFKCLPVPSVKTTTLMKKGEKKTTEKDSTTATGDQQQQVVKSLLPPPPYCEKYFRRTQIDFELPYDIWWAYTNSKLPARVTVPSWNYRKIRTNVYAESVRPNMAGFDHPTCNCKPDVGCGDDCLNRLVYTECSPSCCPTREKCGNQKIQRHEVAPGVERFMTENKGWGVRTKLPIQKGTYILEYVGEVVTEREFKDRMGTIYLNDTHHYCLHLDGGLVIDGHRMGSDGRFVNHSCLPNCEMQKWSVNGLSRMALFAARNIEEGEELTYDYNFSLFNPSEGQPCRCNTPQCRGVIGGKSQRVKPLPIEAKPCENSTKDASRNGRQRKRKAKKNSARLQSKDVVVARVQQLSEKDKKYVKQHGVFLVRNFEKIRKHKRKQWGDKTPPHGDHKGNTSTPSSPSGSPAAITSRRPSTPASLAAQISALRSPRNIKTRGLAMAVQDPELEKMAKMAVILREICMALEALKDPSDEKISLTASLLAGTVVNKKKKLNKTMQKEETVDFQSIQSNIEKGFYKQPAEFDEDMKFIFEQAKQTHGEDEAKLKTLSTLIETYEQKKQDAFNQLLELVNEEACNSFINPAKSPQPQTKEEPNTTPTEKIEAPESTETKETITPQAETVPTVPEAPKNTLSPSLFEPPATSQNEDIIRCICGLYKDEGLMIQCARCMVWQHTECTKADINADSYLCENCEPRVVDREIPLEDFTEDGHRYYLSLMRGELHVRQGDTVYVLRDIPMKDADGNVVPTKKHTYETIGQIEFTECDIFRVERLWKNNEGKRFIFGHHFLRPHETFHEPTRRFYPNEVVRVPLYEVVPIELVIGRCWVLDRTTFCKGRPTECNDEDHCYICELRVDKSARFFSKAKVNYPTCTKSYAFRKFIQKLKISKTYAPHDVDPAMLKSKKQKTDIDTGTTSNTPVPPTRNEANKTPPNVRRRQGSNSPATVQPVASVTPIVQTIKEKRSRLEDVLKAMKLKTKNTQSATNEPPLDLSYLLSGRGARQRKTNTSAATSVYVPV